MGLLPTPSAGAAVRASLLAVATARIARGAVRRPPLRPGTAHVAPGRVTVVVPARDEAHRLGPCLDALQGQGAEVVVVDDGSTDRTAGVAADAGALVVDAGPLPPGWAGKAHALQVGLEAATTPMVVSLDADVRLAPGALAVLVDALGDRSMVTAAVGVDEPDAGGRAVHAAMLATLLYRFGPPGVAHRRVDRMLASGQCVVMDRAAVLDAGGLGPVAGNLIEDVALARHLATAGHDVAFVDATAVAVAQGYGDAGHTLRGWGRSLPLAEVTATPWLVADLALLWATMALPLPRLLTGRGDVVDLAAVALRAGVTVATAPAFRPRGPAVALSPLADLPVVATLTRGALFPTRSWRGRVYG